MSNQKSTLPTSMPPSYQQALGKTTTDDYKNYEVGDAPSENKQMLLAAENNSTKQEVSHQVNSNPNPQQLVQMTVVPVTSPPSTSINQAQETNRQAYYCNQCRTLTNVQINVTYSQCTYIWACVLCCFASPLLTCVPFCMKDLRKTTIYCKRCQRPIESTEKNSTRANIILTVVLLIGLTVSVLLLIWRISMMKQSYSYGG